ncbi:thioesterase family protein [Natrinema sp. 1APR25-10V2]|uniref:acyl-CoA thioesterase n=1 Tax=Natrinema sp. 1APR25-10V2 TaxID=2951081 RepID=UPI002875CEAA|nr:thioesterase family protein [Natrinema sp. 1APR25-10V2]MDS0474983.1 acyl-CoA thioesterase [Natrinema sp. 1APR25-10V2]
MAVYETTIDVRTDDLGRSGHVNNAKFVAYSDLARDRYLAERHGCGLEDLSHAVVHLEIDYEGQLRSLTPITVGIDVADVGETSFTLTYEIRDGDRVAATLTTVAVVLDGENESMSIPESLREGLLSDREAGELLE